MAELIFSDIEDGDVEAVVSLWQLCGLTRPWNNPYHDIGFARASAHSSVLVGRAQAGGDIVASVMVGHDGHRGWVYYLSVAPDQQGMGYGRQAMEAAERWQLQQGIWKMQLLVRKGNEKVLHFYDGLGYTESQTQLLERWIDVTKRGDYEAP